MNITEKSRRQFLHYLAASPIAGAMAGIDFASGAAVISNPADAIDIFDLKETASNNIPPAHWGYLATGVNDDSTLRANRTAFQKYYARSKRLVSVQNIDMSVEILGTRWPTPIILAPLGSQNAFHSEGETGSARAAKSRNHLQVLSTVSSTSVEEVSEARDAPIWYQLYTMGGWDGIQSRLRRAEAAGCPVVVLTVDMAGGTGARHTLLRSIRQAARACAGCHAGNGVAAQGKPMLDGIDENAPAIDLSWAFLDRLRQETTMKVFVKGIVTAEDAEKSLEHGVDGIIVSNHGGRADDSGRGAIESLEEVSGVVQGRTPLFMDSGIRRGVDIFKALALGADAVLIGRPYIYGLGAFGQAGVERALDILTGELRMAMQSFGTPTLADIGADSIARF